MIEEIVITNLKRISVSDGDILHGMKKTDDGYSDFGEIYFSYILKDKIKAWKIHKKMTLNYAVIIGEIKLVLYDDRKNSSSKGNLMEIYSSPENYKLITVPPLVWNGFKTVGSKPAIVANCSTLPHQSNEILRKKPDDDSIPYNWNLKNR